MIITTHPLSKRSGELEGTRLVVVLSVSLAVRQLRVKM
jgi:hypothetical protein